MTPTRLRAWTRKYGNAGWLMVAAYFAGCWFWTKRLYTLPTGLLALLLGIAWLHPHAKPHVSPPPPPVPIAVPAPAPPAPQPEAEEETAEDILEATFELREGRDVWKVEIRVDPEGSCDRFVLFYKNAVLVKRLRSSEELGQTYLDVGRVKQASRFPIVALRGESAGAVSATTHFYQMRHGKLIKMGAVGRFADGPIFRDYDGDGKPEWVFDEYDWEDYYTEKPTHRVIYKELKNGKLRLWKRLPNPHRRHLPQNIVWDYPKER